MAQADHSHAQQERITCPDCGTDFDTDVWLVIDTAARPDLTARARAGDLHDDRCPNGHPRHYDVPLLLYVPAWDPPLLLSPAEHTTVEEDEDQAETLLVILRDALGPAWDDRWLAGGLRWVTRDRIGIALDAGWDALPPPEPPAPVAAPPAPTGYEEAVVAGDWGAVVARAGFDAAPEPFRCHALHRAGEALVDRFGAGRDPADLDAGIEMLARAAALRCSSSQAAVAASALGNALVLRHDLSGDAGDLDSAVTHLRAAIAAAPKYSQAAPGLWSNLALVHGALHELHGAVDHLDAAIRAHDRAVALERWPTAARGRHLSNYAVALHDRYQRAGDAQDLERAIDVLKESLRLAEDPGDRAAATYNLAVVRASRYELLGDPADLDAAAGAQMTLPARQQAADPGATWNNLANAHLARYELSGDEDALAEGVAAAMRAVSLSSPRSPYRAGYLTTRARALGERYERTGALDDLNRSIADLREAVAIGAPQSVWTAHHLTSLGVGLSQRYQRTGALDDLDEALSAWERATALTPPGSPHHHTLAANLASARLSRYERFGDAAAVATAITDIEEHLGLLGARAPVRLTLLANLATARRMRFDQFGDAADLAAAVGAARAVAAATPPEAPDAGGRLGGLALTLLTVHRRAADEQLAAAALERALELARAAVARQPRESTEWPGLAFNLAIVLQADPGTSGAPEAVTAAFREAATAAGAVVPEVALAAGQSWGDWAAGRGAWDEAAEAYRLAMAALDALFGQQLLRGHKESWLGAAVGLPPAAAVALARTGEPGAAVAALEAGRAMLLSEVLDEERAELDGLAATGHAELAGRYRAAADRLAVLRQRELSGPRHRPSPPAAPAEIRAARRAWEQVVDDIRRVPGHEEFLARPSLAAIQEAARPPIAYVAPGPAGGTALVARSDAVEALPLPDLTDAATRAASDELLGALPGEGGDRAWRSALDRVCAWLWDAAMGPLLSHVHEPALTLVPAGRTVLLPLHAAWRPDATRPSGRRYAIDDAAIAYAPSAMALLAARRRLAAMAAPARLVTVRDPEHRRAPLPFTAAEAEASRLLLTDGADLARERAALEQVLASLRDADVAHLACHGLAVPGAPLDSHLRLAGGDRLDVAELMANPRAAALRLVVLSACETGIPGGVLPDEAVGLPVGFLHAGAAGVVATGWPVEDDATAVLMTRFYRVLSRGVADPAAALRLAQAWVRDSTNGAKARHLRHLMRAIEGTGSSAAGIRALYYRVVEGGAEHRDHTHPDRWAAAAFSGAGWYHGEGGRVLVAKGESAHGDVPGDP